MNKGPQKHITRSRSREIQNHIFSDRTRTNLLKKSEQRLITFLVQRIPTWVTSNMLTAFGFFGSMIVSASFILAAYLHDAYLLLGLLGFLISWFGDSLDGRLAYYRNKPRKFYGFVLDITIDWISIILIGYGYIIYSQGIWEVLGYVFVVFYGWEMIIALMRYKITGNYSIDAGILGPTEARIIISCLMVLEVFLPGSIKYSALFVVILVFITNIIDTRKLLKISDDIDKKINESKS
jgi:phosphatidylglycerophosphate synthase